MIQKVPATNGLIVDLNFIPLASNLVEDPQGSAEDFHIPEENTTSTVNSTAESSSAVTSWYLTLATNWQLNRQETSAAPYKRQHRKLIKDLGWSEKEAREAYRVLQVFEDDWNAPGMEAYDEL